MVYLPLELLELIATFSEPADLKRLRLTSRDTSVAAGR